MIFLWSVGHTRLPWQLCKFPCMKSIPSHPQPPPPTQHTHCIAMASSTTPTLVCLRIVVDLLKSLYKAVLLLKIPTPTMHPSFPLPSHPQTVSLPGHHPLQSAFVSRLEGVFSSSTSCGQSLSRSHLPSWPLFLTLSRRRRYPRIFEYRTRRFHFPTPDRKAFSSRSSPYSLSFAPISPNTFLQCF